MQSILSSIIAHTGIVLKTSENSFQSLRLYLLLPALIDIFTLIIEAVESVNTGALVIASE